MELTLDDLELIFESTIHSAFQVGRAQKYTARAGLSKQVTFVKGDFMALAEQFGENSFDAV